MMGWMAIWAEKPKGRPASKCCRSCSCTTEGRASLADQLDLRSSLARGGRTGFEAMDLDAAELLLQLQLQTVLFAAAWGRDSRATVARRLERHVPGVLACAEGCALAALADLAVEIDE